MDGNLWENTFSDFLCAYPQASLYMDADNMEDFLCEDIVSDIFLKFPHVKTYVDIGSDIFLKYPQMQNYVSMNCERQRILAKLLTEEYKRLNNLLTEEYKRLTERNHKLVSYKDKLKRHTSIE